MLEQTLNTESSVVSVRIFSSLLPNGSIGLHGDQLKYDDAARLQMEQVLQLKYVSKIYVNFEAFITFPA